jgi:hypothetical protein
VKGPQRTLPFTPRALLYTPLNGFRSYYCQKTTYGFYFWYEKAALVVTKAAFLC